jgi:hypothetical protein
MKKSINFYKSDKREANRNSLFVAGKKIIASIFLCLLFSQVSFSQTDLTTCYGSCTSGDFVITRAYLSNINGVEITSAACNTPGATVTAYLSFVFTNTTNSDRNGIFISGTINGQYIFKCFPGILPKKKSTTFTDASHPVTWTCGTDLTLKGTFTSWGSAGEQVCDITCSQATPSKCRTVGDLVIQTPLSNNFTFAGRCATGNTVQTIDFTGTASGGDHNYTYSWTFGDGGTSTALSPSHLYASAGVKTVTFTVTDGTGTSKSVTNTNVAVATCCTTPTITTQPSPQTKCAGSSASFTVASTGGNPAPTLQWQVSTNSGTSWTNLTNVSPYSGVTTTTLSLSTTTTALNGNQYRCVLTSGSCTPANSNGALLTVNGIPAAPGVDVVNNCDGSSDLTATGSGSLLWSNSATTTSIHVTNATPTSYTVTQTVSGCTSAAGSGTTAPKTAPGAPSVAYNAPACDQNTFSVTISSVSPNAIYSISDKNGNIIPGVSPGNSYTAPNNSNFSFSNIPAGSGYKVTVSANGCPSTATSCGNSNARQTSTPVTRSATLPVQAITLDEPLTKVTAAPNPFDNRIRFSLQSAVSGQGTLELYDMLGQKLKTVFQGYVQKGQIKTIEYSVPGAQHSNIIYLFKVGSQRKTGILIGVK